MEPPESAKDIEITPEMVEAGADAIQRFFSFELERPERIAASVFSAMSAVAPTASEDQVE